MATPLPAVTDEAYHFTDGKNLEGEILPTVKTLIKVFTAVKTLIKIFTVGKI